MSEGDNEIVNRGNASEPSAARIQIAELFERAELKATSHRSNLDPFDPSCDQHPRLLKTSSVIELPDLVLPITSKSRKDDTAIYDTAISDKILPTTDTIDPGSETSDSNGLRHFLVVGALLCRRSSQAVWLPYIVITIYATLFIASATTQESIAHRGALKGDLFRRLGRMSRQQCNRETI
jgi:hypothetical protein